MVDARDPVVDAFAAAFAEPEAGAAATMAPARQAPAASAPSPPRAPSRTSSDDECGGDEAPRRLLTPQPARLPTPQPALLPADDVADEPPRAAAAEPPPPPPRSARAVTPDLLGALRCYGDD